MTCKGRGFCGRPACPILRRLEEMAELPRAGRKIEGLSPPEVFVGRKGYPLVRAGPMLPLHDDLQATAPSLGMDVGEIIALRASMVRSEARLTAKEARWPGKVLESCQQMAMSSDPVGAEVSFLKPPRGRLQFDGVLSPSGPSGELQQMEITTNPMVPRKVDQLVEDRDALAFHSVAELYASGIEMDHISRLLSLGLLGKERKLVPTRWSITACDDMTGKALRDQIFDRPLISDYLLYSGGGLGNHFEILLLPRPYSFELLETWMAGSAWAPEGWIGSDREENREKKGYSPLAGGYYAARLAVLEHLAKRGRQAAVLAVREISEAYWAPLGVWVVREAARETLQGAPRRFSTLPESLEEMAKGLRTPSEKWRTECSLLQAPVQLTLSEF